MTDTVKNDTVDDTVKCLNCGKKLTERSQRAKFCSDACKLKFNRIKKQGFTVSPTSVGDAENTGLYESNDTVDTVTATDQLFIDDAAKRGLVNWYNFSKELYERKCIWDEKLFSTHLKLNKYCSPECRNNNSKPLKGE